MPSPRRDHGIYFFDWECPKCRGFGSQLDNRLFKFCPYCGGPIRIDILEK